jgi:diacylglycerol kinase family enzyme
MLIAPHANLDDHLLDAIILEDVSKTYLLKMRPAFYKGSHIGFPKVRERKISTIAVESDEQLLVETDGEIIGEVPASFSLIPSALTIMV